MFQNYYNRIFPTKIDSDEVLKEEGVGVFKNTKPLTGYKKVRCKNGNVVKNIIVDIEVPENSVIVKSYGKLNDFNLYDDDNNKLRTNNYTIKSYSDSNVICDKLSSLYNDKYEYKIGESYYEKVDRNVNKQCSRGLHFFLHKEDAENF